MSAFNPTTTDATAALPATAVHGTAHLSHWGVLRAQGADAATFLHGQLTQDVSSLGANEARLAGYCSAKGRLLASFVIVKGAADEVLLLCHRSTLPSALKRLSMFVLRAKCKLSDATDHFDLEGLLGDSATATLPVWGKQDAADGTRLLRLPDAWNDAGAAVRRAVRMSPRWADTPALPAPTLALADWLAWSLRAGVPDIEAATMEQFVPQMVNFELIGGVNFKKGCYPGQEIVARSQYRGTTKRRVFLFECAQTATAGQEVFHDADVAQPAGMVVNAATLAAGGGLALIEVKLATLGHGALRLGAADGPVLTQRALPYAIQIDHEVA
jgi:folate-binding protein YgfZ